MITIVKSGIVIKTELITNYNPVYGLNFIWNILNMALITIILQKRLQTGKLPLVFIIILTGYITFSLLISGERGSLFRYLLTVTILIHILFKKIKLRYFWLGIFLGGYVGTILGAFKMFLLTDLRLADIPGILSLEYSNIVETMLAGEFTAASENLGVVLQMVPSSISYMYGRLMINDLIRAIIPGFLFARDTFYSTSLWFNETFFSRAYDMGMGMGFSLVAYGYVNFGYPGVVGLFLLLGWLTKKLYHKAGQSNIYLISYLAFIAVLISAIRADLTSVISQGWKHILLPILLMIWFGRIMRKEGQPSSTGGTIRKPFSSPRSITARGRDCEP
jgi:oligosaccharide repeat unit polymerase